MSAELSLRVTDVVVISLRVVRTSIGTVRKPVFDHGEWLLNYSNL